MLVCFWKVTCSWGSWFRLFDISWLRSHHYSCHIKWRHMPHRSQKASWTLPAARPGSQLDNTWLQLNLHIYIYLYIYVCVSVCVSCPPSLKPTFLVPALESKPRRLFSISAPTPPTSVRSGYASFPCSLLLFQPMPTFRSFTLPSQVCHLQWWFPTSSISKKTSVGNFGKEIKHRGFHTSCKEYKCIRIVFFWCARAGSDTKAIALK